MTKNNGRSAAALFAACAESSKRNGGKVSLSLTNELHGLKTKVSAKGVFVADVSDDEAVAKAFIDCPDTKITQSNVSGSGHKTNQNIALAGSGMERAALILGWVGGVEEYDVALNYLNGVNTAAKESSLEALPDGDSEEDSKVEGAKRLLDSYNVSVGEGSAEEGLGNANGATPVPKKKRETKKEKSEREAALAAALSENGETK